MFRRGRWQGFSEDDLLELLKKEIKRLGIEDRPSRTELQKGYDKHNMPSPSWYLGRYGTWEEVLNKAGISYDKSSYIKKINSKAGKAKKDAKWQSMSDDLLIDITIEEMRRKSETVVGRYNEVRDKAHTPSVETLYNRGIKWTDVKNAYKSKYGAVKGSL